MLSVIVGGASGVMETLPLNGMLVAGYMPSVGGGVPVGLADGVFVAVLVAVFVDVLVGVLVDVFVAVGVNVLVELGVGVFVFVEVGVEPATVKLPFVVTEAGSPSL